MRPRSLRARLALWHAGLLALTLIALAALTLVLLRNFLSSRLDAGLFEDADTTARTIADSLYRASLDPPNPQRKFLNKELKEPGRMIQIVDASTGRATEWSPALNDTRIPTRMEERVRALRGQSTFETRYDFTQYPARVVTVPVQQGKNVPYLVQNAAELKGIDEALQRASLILAVLTPTVFVFSLLGGWFLVGRSLHTVDEITRTAVAIEHTNLDRRIEPPGTDDEISRLASAFNEMIARLDRSFRQIEQFSADASHELKTPLTSIRGEAEVALMGERPAEEYRDSLKTIVGETERMSAIVENLLLLARADARQIDIKRDPVDLAALTMSVYEQLEPFAHRKQILIEIEQLDDATVPGDRIWLSQIITNLLSNAIKYTSAGGQVWINLESGPTTQRPIDPTTRLSIRDSGPGIAHEHLPHIFDRFYRVDAGRSRDAGGSGLGLSIARWAAEAHDGRIEVQSEVGKGSTFTLILPAFKPSA